MDCFLTFTEPLPGRKAQLEMAPIYRTAGLLHEVPPANALVSAVLIVLTPTGTGRGGRALLNWRVLLIRRTTYPGIHSGQIAFPGGRQERGDKGLWETACREAFEEVGIDERRLEKIGPLTSLYVPPSNFLIHPFVAIDRTLGHLIAQPREVVDYKLVPLRVFDPAEARLLEFDYQHGEKRTAPAWLYEDYTIWGATAMILSELYRIVDGDAVSCA